MKTVEAVNTVMGPKPGETHLPGSVFMVDNNTAMALVRAGAVVIINKIKDSGDLPKKQSKKRRKGR